MYDFKMELKYNKLKKITLNPIVKNMIYILHVTRRYLKEKSPLSSFSPIWGTNYFAPGRADGGFKIWADLGLGVVKDAFGGGMEDF